MYFFAEPELSQLPFGFGDNRYMYEVPILAIVNEVYFASQLPFGCDGDCYLTQATAQEPETVASQLPFGGDVDCYKKAWEKVEERDE